MPYLICTKIIKLPVNSGPSGGSSCPRCSVSPLPTVSSSTPLTDSSPSDPDSGEIGCSDPGPPHLCIHNLSLKNLLRFPWQPPYANCAHRPELGTWYQRARDARHGPGSMVSEHISSVRNMHVYYTVINYNVGWCYNDIHVICTKSYSLVL